MTGGGGGGGGGGTRCGCFLTVLPATATVSFTITGGVNFLTVIVGGAGFTIVSSLLVCAVAMPDRLMRKAAKSILFILQVLNEMQPGEESINFSNKF